MLFEGEDADEDWVIDTLTWWNMYVFFPAPLPAPSILYNFSEILGSATAVKQRAVTRGFGHKLKSLWINIKHTSNIKHGENVLRPIMEIYFNSSSLVRSGRLEGTDCSFTWES